jgi:DNA-binding MarR family transcriptional regulator
MSVEASRWAWSIKGLDLKQKMTLIALADCCRSADGTQSCWPSIDHLVGMTELSRASVFRAIKALEKLNLIKVERRRNRSSVYHLRSHRETLGVSQGDLLRSHRETKGSHAETQNHKGTRKEPERTGSLSRTQQADKIAKAYCDRSGPLASFHPARDSITRALRAGYSAEEIELAIKDVEHSAWALTVNTLRTALERRKSTDYDALFDANGMLKADEP